MDNTYELMRKKNKYKNIRENVVNMINVLSNSNVNDNLTMVQTNLKNYYLVNDSACKLEEIKKQKQRISDCLTLLNSILKSINSKIYNINVDIQNAEAMENGEL